jgi:glycosyltransferase involved in cell wall biosynthesis
VASSRLAGWAHEHLPRNLIEAIRRSRAVLFWTRLGLRELPRWRDIRRAPVPRDGFHVFYGHDRMPSREDVVFGGQVKFQRLDEELPNEPRHFNVLYLGSTSLPLDARVLVRIARSRGAKVVWNQNGVRYPGLGLADMNRINRRDGRLLHAADYVFFQSAFCKVSADRFYGERSDAWEVLHNAVDTRTFTPANVRPSRPLTLLLGGNQYQRYRLEVALETLALLRVERPEVRLLVTGDLSFLDDPAEARAVAEELVARRGLAGHVDFTGAYIRAEAPDVLRAADILLHTKYNDPCPTLVVEAMACGVPVVYSASGGVPELVGDEGGIGIPAPLDFERDHPPEPAPLAEAVLKVTQNLEGFAEAARRRAVERFDLRAWVERHRQVFAALLSD